MSAISQDLADQGKVVEAGWLAMRLTMIPKTASQSQLDAMRNAFYAGAQHVFASLMTLLDEGQEPTKADLLRVTSIVEELDEWVSQMKTGVN